MAPTGPADSFDGNDFSNNLFTDLSPLLTLFGEQVTKQFLSLSLTGAENILLAMGPIGILTIVVSAIRVSGGPILKALVGRAREEKAAVEHELLSSTSDEVCEMWNGTSIVRTKGKAPTSMKTLIIDGSDMRILTVPQAGGKGIYPALSSFHRIGKSDSTDPSQSTPPNLTLNLNSSTKLGELRAFAAFGVLLQASGLAVSAITKYHLGWTQSGKNDPSFAYPCFLVGSLLLFVGVITCGHIIEGATMKTNLTCSKPHREHVVVFRLQEACTVGDQHFPSAIIFNPVDNPDISISQRKEVIRKPWLNALLPLLLSDPGSRRLTSFATALTMAGFFLQFIGIRSLHWSTSIIQLGITAVMTLVRAYVRRGLSKDLPCFEAPRAIQGSLGAEAAWFIRGVVQTAQKKLIVTRSTAVDEFRNLSFILQARVIFGSFGLSKNRLVDIEILTGCFWHEKRSAPGGVYIAKPCKSSFSQRIKRDLPQNSTPTGQSFQAGWNQKVRLLADLANCVTDVIRPDVAQKAKSIVSGIFGILQVIRKSNHPNGGGIINWQEDSPFSKAKVWTGEERFWEIDLVNGTDSEQLRALKSKLDQLNIYRPEKRLDVPFLQSIEIKIPQLEQPGNFPQDIYNNLTAILVFWQYSLAILRPTNRGRISEPPRRFARVIGVNPPHPNCKTRELGEWINRAVIMDSCTRGHERSNLGCQQESGTYDRTLEGPYFGMYLSSLSYFKPDFPRRLYETDHSDGESPVPVDSDIFIVDHHDTTIIEQMGRELFSLFILALAFEIKKIPGQTTKTDTRRWANTFLDALADEAVKAGIAKDLDDALTLVIPAFARYNLLPKSYSEQEEEGDAESTSGAPGIQSGSEGLRRRKTGIVGGEASQNRDGDGDDGQNEDRDRV